MKKRILAMVLGLAMIFTSVPSAYGYENKEITHIENDVKAEDTQAKETEVEDTESDDTEAVDEDADDLDDEADEDADDLDDEADEDADDLDDEADEPSDESDDKKITKAPSLNETNIKINLFGYEPLEDGTYNTGTKITVLDVEDVSTITAEADSENLVVTVTDNNVNLFPKKKGNYVVTISADGQSLTANIKVQKIYFKRHKYSAGDSGNTNWVMGSTMLGLYKGESATLVAKGFDENSIKKWSSSDESVATVNKEGLVTAKKYGYATITLECEDYILTYKVGVSYEKAIKALRYAIKYYGYPYSQPRRMQDGYFDCSSYVWRAYRSAGVYFGGSKTWAPTAAGQAAWSAKKHYTMFEGTVSLDSLLPGDLVYWTGKKNGRYKGIYHVDMYQGAGWFITNTNQKYRVGSISRAVVIRPCCTKNTSVSVSNTAFNYNKVKWNTVYGATGYKLYRSTKKDKGFTKIATVKNAKYYIDTNIKAGKTYYYKTLPYWKNSKATYNGKYSAVKKVKTEAVYPTIKAKIVDTGVKFSWSLIDGADRYIVYRKRKATDKWEVLTVVESSTKKSYTDTTVKGGKTYYYTVRACKGKYSGKRPQDGVKIKYLKNRRKSIWNAQ